MLKSRIKHLLQFLLGFNNFLFIFSIITIKKLYSNKYEKEFIYFLNLLPVDKILLDVGANIGIMTVPMAKKAINGKVYAFEPMPENLKALKRIIKFFKLRNVTVVEIALGSKPGELKMVMPVVNDVKMQGLSHVVDENNTDEGTQLTVTVKRLDDLPELQHVNIIGGIKIDVENFELEVFKGAEKLLIKHKPLIYCELWDNEKRMETIDYLKNKLGYNIKVFDGEKLINFTNQKALNFFMVP